jgi:phosphoglycolate phosphatase (TIGR01487 family)
MQKKGENPYPFVGLITDVDGTITDPHRRIHTGAIQAIRDLVDTGTEVILASGNTACFMDALGRMIGTSGSFIGENGGIYRIGYGNAPVVLGDQSVCRIALEALVDHFRQKGTELELYSPTYRFADLAFARTVPVPEVREVVAEFPVEVLDTGFAIHLQTPGINKGKTFSVMAAEMGYKTTGFLAIGDAQNDIDLLHCAGAGVAVGNAHPDAARAADWVSEKSFGDGFVEAIQRYSAYFRER